MNSSVVAFTWLWLQEPATWVAVLGPALLSAFALWRHWLTRREFLLLLLGMAVGVACATISEVDGRRMLTSRPWLAMAILSAACVRAYLPHALKAFAMCWLCAFGVDLAVMIPARADYPDLRLPYGIGGAGFGDALFVEPVTVAVTLLVLQAVRRWDAKRKAAQA